MLLPCAALLAASSLPSSSLLRPAAIVPAHARAPHVRMQQQEQKEKQGRFPLPFLQPGVPADQQPTAEMRNLRSQFAMDWADDDGYTERLFDLYKGLMLFLSLPISYVTFYNLPQELPNLLVAANIGSIVAMVPFVARLRVGWGFVSQRLLDRNTYYEANQRGYVATKDKADILRDRLIQ